MISKEEIKEKANQFKINPTDVERDYVFGWILNGIYNKSILKDYLILKGGNLFRKAYSTKARFSKDLDFGYQIHINPETIIDELNQICESIYNDAGVDFEIEKNKIEIKQNCNNITKAYEARLYFKDFNGNRSRILLSAKLDIAEMQKIHLPIQKRELIHPYSDSISCSTVINCIKLEENLADKLKCLLQRRHIADLFDLIHLIFFDSPTDLNKLEIISTFLKKTIFSKNPNAAKEILLGLPLNKLEKAWNEYIIAPLESLFDFDIALDKFQTFINENLFGSNFSNKLIFYPSNLRNKIIESGTEQKTLHLDYEGYVREVEPYSLTYKIRADGFGQEYFYGYDLTGGSSRKIGIKMFLHEKIHSLEITNNSFKPRFEIELSKAGEFGKKPYFPRIRKRFIFGKRKRNRKKF